MQLEPNNALTMFNNIIDGIIHFKVGKPSEIKITIELPTIGYNKTIESLQQNFGDVIDVAYEFQYGGFKISIKEIL